MQASHCWTVGAKHRGIRACALVKIDFDSFSGLAHHHCATFTTLCRAQSEESPHLRSVSLLLGAGLGVTLRAIHLTDFPIRQDDLEVFLGQLG